MGMRGSQWSWLYLYLIKNVFFQQSVVLRTLLPLVGVKEGVLYNDDYNLLDYIIIYLYYT